MVLQSSGVNIDDPVDVLARYSPLRLRTTNVEPSGHEQ
jgi:hypothetical protein